MSDENKSWHSKHPKTFQKSPNIWSKFENILQLYYILVLHMWRCKSNFFSYQNSIFSVLSVNYYNFSYLGVHIHIYYEDRDAITQWIRKWNKKFQILKTSPDCLELINFDKIKSFGFVTMYHFLHFRNEYLFYRDSRHFLINQYENVNKNKNK